MCVHSRVKHREEAIYLRGERAARELREPLSPQLQEKVVGRRLVGGCVWGGQSGRRQGGSGWMCVCECLEGACVIACSGARRDLCEGACKCIAMGVRVRVMDCYHRPRSSRARRARALAEGCMRRRRGGSLLASARRGRERAPGIGGREGPAGRVHVIRSTHPWSLVCACLCVERAGDRRRRRETNGEISVCFRVKVWWPIHLRGRACGRLFVCLRA